MPRADLTDQPVEVTHNPPAAPVGDIVNSEPTGQAPPSAPGAVDEVTGTWDFTVPSTVTRVEKKNDELSEYSLYYGRPAPTDKPFVVITVAPPTDAGADKASQAAADTATYKVSGTRTYILNGAVASEWTGRTKDGAAFCELILNHPGGGDVCHAMAIAGDEEQRKLALQILGSIVWKAE